jgi:hypothetical protein
VQLDVHLKDYPTVKYTHTFLIHRCWGCGQAPGGFILTKPKKNLVPGKTVEMKAYGEWLYKIEPFIRIYKGVSEVEIPGSIFFMSNELVTMITASRVAEEYMVCGRRSKRVMVCPTEMQPDIPSLSPSE